MTLSTKVAGTVLTADEYNAIIGRVNARDVTPVYDAIVYQDATTTYAVDKNGTVLSSVLISAATDDVPIKAAIAYLDALDASVLYGGHLHINTGLYKISTELTVVKPHTITGSSPTSTVLQTNAAITLFNVNPATSIWQYERFTLRDLKLDGNRVGLYGVTFGNVASVNLYVVKSNFDNLYIEKFRNYGVYENSNWGNVYHNVFFKYNGVATTPPTAINTDSGGICIECNIASFFGCAFDWNTCGIVFKSHGGSSFYSTVVEGNIYHGIYGYSSGASIPTNITFNQLWCESNATHNRDYPASLENLYNIYVVNSDCTYWDIQNGVVDNTYTTIPGLMAGNYTTIRNISGGTITTSGTNCINTEFAYLSGVTSAIQTQTTDLLNRSDAILTKNKVTATIANGSESGAVTGSGWQGTETITSDVAEYWQGTHSIKVVTPNGVSNEGVHFGSVALSYYPHTASVYLKGSGTVTLALYDTAAWTQSTKSSVITLTETWTRYTVTRTPVSPATGMGIVIATNTKQAATIYIDGIQLERGISATEWVIPYTTKEGATATIADGGTITHSLGTTPVWVVCTPSISGEFISVTTLGATTFTVAIKKHDGTAGTTQTVYWRCGI